MSVIEIIKLVMIYDSEDQCTNLCYTKFHKKGESKNKQFFELKKNIIENDKNHKCIVRLCMISLLEFIESYNKNNPLNINGVLICFSKKINSELLIKIFEKINDAFSKDMIVVITSNNSENLYDELLNSNVVIPQIFFFFDNENIDEVLDIMVNKVRDIQVFKNNKEKIKEPLQKMCLLI